MEIPLKTWAPSWSRKWHKTNDVAGDGTTTATVLAHPSGRKKRPPEPIDGAQGDEKAVNAAVEEIKKIAKPIEGKESIAQVAAISANDEEIGQLIAEAMEKVGNDGVITVEESKGFTTELEVVEGMQFDRGYISPYMITDSDKMEAVLEKPYILITDKKLSNIQEILPILEKWCSRASRSIIAEDMEGKPWPRWWSTSEGHLPPSP